MELQKSQKANLDKTIIREIQKKEARQKNLDLVKVHDPQSGYNEELKNKQQTEKANQKINDMQKAQEQELDDYDDQQAS